MLQKDKQKWPVAVMNQSVFIQKYRIVDQYVTRGNETEEKWGRKGREREGKRWVACAKMCQIHHLELGKVEEKRALA